MAKIEIRKPSEEEIEEKGIRAWPIWEHGPATFPWRYEERETCLILEGRVTVKTAEGEVSFGEGDLVIFPEGLECEWRIHEPVRKHYRFG
ncbi:MAG: DUF861 domain-containing protein [Candidatus Hydrogenedentota bacterium]|nr:MAG: DUF861 domain-containing protein [Candidatus Hydrogenedentota bacterium]